MKNHLYLILLLPIIIATACHKDTTVAIATGLTGKWELRTVSGGFAPNINYSLGNGSTIQFNSDSTFVQYQSFNVTNQGSYNLVKLGPIQTGVTSGLLYFNHKLYNVLQQQGNTLMIGNSAADGIQYNYVRL